MNLLYTITSYPPAIGGAQLHTHHLAREMTAHSGVQVVCHWDGNRTDWLIGTTVQAPGEDRDYVHDGVSVHRMGLTLREKLSLLPLIPFYYPLMSLIVPRISRLLQQKITVFIEDADLVHNVRIGREPLTHASLAAAREAGIPFVLTPVHHPRWKGWRYAVYEQIYRQADAVIALTTAEMETLIGLGVNPDRIHVTGMGPVLSDESNPTRFREKHGINGPFVLFVGQHYAYKGYRQVLESRHRVWESFAEAHYVFIGPKVGSSEDIFRTTDDPRVHRLGSVDLQEKTDALAACTLLCVPSTQESFGGVYTEAWSFYKPVIGCRIPSVSEVVREGEDGFLVEQQVEEIAERIMYLLSRPGEAESMGMAGREKVESRYSWERLGELTRRVYEEVST